MSIEAGLKAISCLASAAKAIVPVIWKPEPKDAARNAPVTVQQNVVLQQHIHHHYYYYTTIVVRRRRR